MSFSYIMQQILHACGFALKCIADVMNESGVVP